MEELLKKLVESEMLTESTKDEILSSINEAINTQVEDRTGIAVKAEKAKLKEAFFNERKSLVESIDAFLKENLKGALSKNLDAKYKKAFEVERSSLVESISAFLDMHMKGMKAKKGTKQNAMYEAFYNMVKTATVNEQELDDKVAELVGSLKESLQREKGKTNKLYGELVEANKSKDAIIVEHKKQECLRMIPQSQRPLAKRLLEGVTLEKFDVVAKQVVTELVESDASDDKTISKQRHSEKEVVVESTQLASNDGGMSRSQKLAGIK